MSNKKKILLIDDAEFILESTSVLLEFEGYDVITASDGTKGIELAMNEKPDLIICDVSMPGLSGYDVITHLRNNKETATIPFIFLTALTEKTKVREGMQKGADDYLTKPFGKEELIGTINAQLKKIANVETHVRHKVEEVGRKLNYALPHEFRTVLSQIMGSVQILSGQIDELTKEGRIRINKALSYTDSRGNKIDYIPEKLQDSSVIIDNNWTDLPGYEFGVFTAEKFSTQNSEVLLRRVVEATSKAKDLVMDFFLGSGTTTAVAHKLGRKWIGVEMGEHFYTVVLPRMKKVLAYDNSGISKEVKEYQGGGFFKYYELEQYEDTLRKVKYEDSNLFDNPYQDLYNQYVFMRDLKMLEALEIDYENNKVKVDLSKLYSNIDIPETLSNLLGKWIKKITPDYVEFENGEQINLKDLDYKVIKPLIWW